ncbi:MAG TPA: pantoate--beta-alanine ligase, partial [Candidatus Omnitrophica bacterium]|nr:pantoate--beta-alanine ligase [Candidatus Omnitrophota bacterium]
KAASANIDYISITDTQALRPLKKVKGSCLIALAVWIGKTRLIDNAVVKIK